MTEISRFWTTNDVGDGPAAGYEQDLFADFMEGVFTEGILKGRASELTVTAAVSPITILSGAAIVGGRYYQNTALLQLPVTTPSTGTTGFNVVLSADWTAQEVRAEITMSADGNSAYPPVVDNPGTEVQIVLMQGIISVAGNITLNDSLRNWASFSSTIPEGSITTAKLADNAVITDKINDSAVTSAKLKSGSVTEVKIGTGAVTWHKLGDGAISDPKIAPGGLGVETADIVNQQIERVKLGYGAPRMIGHQGNNWGYWTYPGTTLYDNSLIVEMQCGSFFYQLSNQSSTNIWVTYPHNYLHGTPLVFISLKGNYPDAFQLATQILEISTTQFRVSIVCRTGNVSLQGEIYWMSMGGQI